MKKEQIYVLVKNEEIRKQVADVLNKHNQNIDAENEGLFNYNDFPCLKFNTDANCWVMSAYKSVRTSINIEMLDKILSQSKSEKENGWYKHTNGVHKFWLVYYDFKNNVRYGFNGAGDWFKDNYTDYKACLELANENEITIRLIEEATKRGFKKGLPIISPYGVDRGFELISDHFVFLLDTNTLFCKENGVNLFHDGNWAIIKQINQPSMQDVANHILKQEKSSHRPVEKSILQEAEEIINGSRAEDYGSVTENFTKIAVGWKEIFADGNFTPRRVALAMVWLKICRDVNTPKHDNILDIAGYAGCIGKMDNEANQ